jgi:hypothetical protein
MPGNKLTAKSSQNTTHNINYALQQHVSTQLSHHQATFKTILKVYKETVHVWDPKGVTRVCYYSIVHICDTKGVLL